MKFIASSRDDGWSVGASGTRAAYTRCCKVGRLQMVLARPGMTGGGDFFSFALSCLCLSSACWLRVVNVGCGGCCCLPEKLSFFPFLARRGG